MVNQPLKHKILVGYGFSKLILGLAQIIGLAAGYFLMELVVIYPKEAYLYVLTEDTIALVYLAVCIRAFFHIVSGIGILRLCHWVRMWLILGWPIVGIITFGLALTLYQEWFDRDLINTVFQIISWPKLFVYFMVMAFDLTAVNSFIKKTDSEAARISINKVILIISAVVFFFSLLLFTGKPLSKGFQQGYYKTEGEIVVQEKQKQLLLAHQVDDGKQLKEKKFVGYQIGSEVNSHQKRLPYRFLMGVLAGLSVLCGLFFQIKEIRYLKEADSISMLAYIFFCLGLFLFIVCLVSFGQYLGAAFSFICFLMCLYIIFLKSKYE